MQHTLYTEHIQSFCESCVLVFTRSAVMRSETAGFMLQHSRNSPIKPENPCPATSLASVWKLFHKGRENKAGLFRDNRRLLMTDTEDEESNQGV